MFAMRIYYLKMVIGVYDLDILLLEMHYFAAGLTVNIVAHHRIRYTRKQKQIKSLRFLFLVILLTFTSQEKIYW